jgi:hypothetical protein
MSKSGAIALLAAMAMVASAPAQAQTRAAMALPAAVQASVPENCLVRPNVPGDKERDRDADGIFDDCGATRGGYNEAAAASGISFSPGILVAILALLGAIAAAAGGGGGGGGNDSPG